MRTTKIEWTEKTWNPITGCTKISNGCKNCYAETMSRRLHGMGNKKYINNFTLTTHEEYLLEPTKWKDPSMIFVCSMSDIFHKDVSFDFIEQVFEVINHTPQHTYQILTKRAERMKEYCNTHYIPKNVWLGVTVEDINTKYRINYLRTIKAVVKFISCEPLLEDLQRINLEGIDWIIVGGESGISARQTKKDWVINIKDQAMEYKIPFFFKQWGTWGEDGIKRTKNKNGNLLNGKVYQNMPIL